MHSHKLCHLTMSHRACWHLPALWVSVRTQLRLCPLEVVVAVPTAIFCCPLLYACICGHESRHQVLFPDKIVRVPGFCLSARKEAALDG